MKSCLNCKYQPEWGRVEGTGIYRRQYGKCRWFESHKVILPACIGRIHAGSIEKMLDNSGLPYNCLTWEPDEAEL